VFLDHIARQATKAVTHSTVAAFVAHTTLRIAVHEPARRARKDAMKSRKSPKSGSMPNRGG
jgi:hypothetical protein